MKAFLFSCVCLTTLYSCNQQPKHPQAQVINQSAATAMTEASILRFADSIDASSKNLEKQSSLVYQLNDVSMYVAQYSQNGTPLMYIENISNEGISSEVKKYYFKNDSLILIKENTKRNKDGQESTEDKRTYIRNNISFKKESRSTPTPKNSNPYIVLKKSAVAKESDAFTERVTTLKDAINSSNKFEVFFDSIIDAPDECHILLKSKLPDGYLANVVVYNKDAYIDSIISRPSVFKDKKLNIKWEIKDNEAVYVPVASSVTSAKGLNK